MKLYLTDYMKAGVGSTVAGLTALQVALLDNGVTTGEWVGVAVAFLVTFGAIWGAPANTKP